VDESTAKGVMRLAPILLAVLAIGFVVVKGCQTGPFGRKQIVALTPEQEARLGAQAYQETLVKESANVVETGPIVQAVRGVAKRLTDATTKPDFLKATQLKEQRMNWEVSVLRSRQVNAFCLPGGKIVVYTAILPICETNQGLATVLGHEIGHALAHHGAERMSHEQIRAIALGGAAASLGDMRPEQRAAVLAALNFGAQAGVLKYSRNHETEADHIGLLLMAAAGYDPREASKFWKRMSAASGGARGPEFMSTHPSHGTRMKNLQSKAWLEPAMELYKAADPKAPFRKLPEL
jgi:predicted Zn-dependent protease